MPVCFCLAASVTLPQRPRTFDCNICDLFEVIFYLSLPYMPEHFVQILHGMLGLDNGVLPPVKANDAIGADMHTHEPITVALVGVPDHSE